MDIRDSGLAKLFATCEGAFATYGSQAFQAIAEPCSVMYGSAVSLWVIWIIIQRVILNKGQIDYGFFHGKIWRAVFVTAFLCSTTAMNDFNDIVYLPTIRFFTNIAFKLVTFGTYEGEIASLSSMIIFVEKHIEVNIIGKLNQMCSGFSFTNVSWVGKILAYFSFKMLILIFFILVLGGQLILNISFMIAPLMLLFWGFDVTKDYAQKGINLMLNGCFRIMMAGASMSLSLGLIAATGFSNLIPVEAGHYSVWSDSSIWSLLSLAWISIYIHWKSGSYADTLSGASIGMGAEGAFAGAGAALKTFMGGKTIGSARGKLGDIGMKAGRNLTGGRG